MDSVHVGADAQEKSLEGNMQKQEALTSLWIVKT